MRGREDVKVYNLFLKLFHLTFLKSVLHDEGDLTQFFK